jgi:acyl-CoA hydrolase
MEIEVEVLAEDPSTGHRRLTTRALVTMVAVDEQDRPLPVPPLLATTDEERQREAEAAERRKQRLARRSNAGP